MKQNYVLFTDTDTDITPAVAQEYGYNLIAMPYTIDGKDVFPYRDFKEFECHAFYDSLRNGVMPTTSALNAKAYKEYFEPFFRDGKDILYVHFSRAMSGSFAQMDIAVKELQAAYPDRKFYAIDTKGITICSYNIVREVGDMYLQGKSAEEIVAWSKNEVDKFPTYFFVNDLKFFKRSGRVKAMAAIMGNLLGIRPILCMDSDGLMGPQGKARGLKGALDKVMEIIDELQEDITKHRIIIGHTDDLKTAQMLRERIEAKYGSDLQIEMVVVNPTAGSHCGPDGVGVCFHGKHR